MRETGCHLDEMLDPLDFDFFFSFFPFFFLKKKFRVRKLTMEEEKRKGWKLTMGTRVAPWELGLLHGKGKSILI